MTGHSQRSDGERSTELVDVVLRGMAQDWAQSAGAESPFGPRPDSPPLSRVGRLRRKVRLRAMRFREAVARRMAPWLVDEGEW